MNRPGTYLLTMALLLASCGDVAERALRRGNTLFDAGDLAGAARAYDRMPTDARLRYNLGTVRLAMDSLDASAMALLEATALVDTSAPAALAWHNLGHALLRGSLQADSLSRATTAPAPDRQLTIVERVRQAVVVDSISAARRRLNHLSDSLLSASVNAYKQSLRHAPTDEDSRHDLGKALSIQHQRRTDPARDRSPQDKPKVPHSERAKTILAQVDSLVDRHHFDEALMLLQAGMKLDSTLKQDEEYMNKLEVVNQAAQAQ